MFLSSTDQRITVYNTQSLSGKQSQFRDENESEIIRDCSRKMTRLIRHHFGLGDIQKTQFEFYGIQRYSERKTYSESIAKAI